ncbi:MAG: endo-1,4-beta-xylanase [Bacilli bacterium]|nr:endo-1,4-beta-xylanase [Bacilli bacterium]
MRKSNTLLVTTLSFLAMSFVVGCSNNNNSSIPTNDTSIKPIEIGDTVKEWTSTDDFEELPMDVANNKGYGVIVEDFGNEDDYSLAFSLNGDGYISTDVIEEPYFTDDDAANGDIISLYWYLPENSNIKSIQLEIYTSNPRGTPISDLKYNISSEDEGKWVRKAMTFNTLETLGSIRLNYTLANTSAAGMIYVDDINVTRGAPIMKTDYEFNDESLSTTYEDYFRVGTCMSNAMYGNTQIRQIVKDNFNSVTCENEGKPEQILDQKACQELAKEDPGAVAITTKPFEKTYNWAEANHIGVRHHTFVWFDQTPAWFFNVGYQNNSSKVSKEVMLQRMENFIRVGLETINDRWPGLVYAIDVANEAIDNGAIRKNNNNWVSVVGNDFVYYAFKFASMYKAEDQELYYNDYSYDYQTNNCKFALNTLLKQAIDEELIDGVGMQGHLDSGANMDNIINDAKMIMQKGLKCQITELDITVNGNDSTNQQNQKKAYKTLIKKILENNEQGLTDINAVIVWGICDNASWKSSQYPLLFTQNYGKKPAYYGFLEAIDEANIYRNNVEEEPVEE